MQNTKPVSGGYGKRPMWEWIVLYVVVGGLIYALMYYFMIAKSGGGYDYSYNTNIYQTPHAALPTSSPAPVGSITMTKTAPKKGAYLVAGNGMTLYVFDNDKTGVSTCYGGCATAWPAYKVGANAPKLPAGMTTVKRSDGTTQYVWKGKPVYYYFKDQKPGDTLGDGVGGIWHLVKP